MILANSTISIYKLIPYQLNHQEKNKVNYFKLKLFSYLVKLKEIFISHINHELNMKTFKLLHLKVIRWNYLFRFKTNFRSRISSKFEKFRININKQELIFLIDCFSCSSLEWINDALVAWWSCCTMIIEEEKEKMNWGRNEN